MGRFFCIIVIRYRNFFIFIYSNNCDKIKVDMKSVSKLINYPYESVSSLHFDVGTAVGAAICVVVAVVDVLAHAKTLVVRTVWIASIECHFHYRAIKNVCLLCLQIDIPFSVSFSREWNWTQFSAIECIHYDNKIYSLYAHIHTK
jgi:hypothetical protein